MKIRSAAVALVAAASLTATAAPAFAVASQKTSAGVLGTWMAAHGDHMSVVYGTDEYADYGLTIDSILALDAAKTGQTEAKKATTYVADNINNYAGDPGAGDYAASYAGATAKALVLAQAQGLGNSLGGADLLTRLQDLETSGGRFADKSSTECGPPYDTVPYGTGCDYSNTFSQSFALIALQRSGATISAAAGDFLLAQQCPGGGFRIQEDAAACTDATKGDSDATAIAIQGLVALPSSTTRTTGDRERVHVPQGPDGLLGRREGRLGRR